MGENIAEPNYQINSPLIARVGFNPFMDTISIQFTSGLVKTIAASFKFYTEFINSENPDDFYFEKIHPSFKKSSR